MQRALPHEPPAWEFGTRLSRDLESLPMAGAGVMLPQMLWAAMFLTMRSRGSGSAKAQRDVDHREGGGGGRESLRGLPSAPKDPGVTKTLLDPYNCPPHPRS